MRMRALALLIIMCIALTLMPTVVLAGGTMTPAVSGKVISANGTALIVNGNDDTNTTVYIDADRDGVLDPGEQSLAAAGIVNAPADGSNLSRYTIFGGADTATITGDSMITINGGNVGSVYGGNYSSYDMSGGVTITMNGGSVARLLACGYNNSVGGTGKNVFVSVHGGIVRGDIDDDINLYSRNYAETTSLIIDGGMIYGTIAVKKPGASFVIKGGNILAAYKSGDLYASPTDGTNSVHKTTLTLKDVTTAKANTTVVALMSDAGYTYGMSDVTTDGSGRLFVYLPEGKSVTEAIIGADSYTGCIQTTADGTAAGELKKGMSPLWTDGISYNAAATFSGGNGSDTSPYLLSDTTDLAQLALNVNNGKNYSGKYFELTTNIDLSGKFWVPIGYGSVNFQGYFNGSNHIISNMNLVRSAYSGSTCFLGLFGWIYNGASIKNLGLTNASMLIDAWDGHDAGLLLGYADTGVSVENCFAEGSITASVAVRSIGGLIGQNYSGGSIKNCFFRGSIDAVGGSYVGGIIGYLRSAVPTNCYVAATIISSATNKSAVSSYAANCYYDITLNSTVTGGEGTAKTTSEMKTSAMSEALGSAWNYVSDLNRGYPYLRSFHVHTGGTASCTENAICDICHQPYGEFTDHSFGALIPESPASHTSTGVKAHYQCSVCDNYFTESKVETTLDELNIPVIPHSYSLAVWETDNTNHWHKCTCGTKFNIEAHSYGEWMEITPATKLLPGEKKRACTVCGHEDFAEIPILVHTHAADGTGWKSDVTNHWKQCTCGNIIELAEHTFEWKTDTEATEDITGIRHEECTVCGYKRNENTSIPKLPHTHSWVEIPVAASDCLVKGNNQYFYCTKCHKYYKADKTTVTTVAEETLAYAGHNYGTLIPEVSASHFDTGMHAYYKCDICGKHFTEAKVETTSDGLNIPVIPHSYGTDWKKDDNNHWIECDCGKKIDVAAHTYGDWIEITPATETSVGKKEHVCSVCGCKEISEIQTPGTIPPTPEIIVGANGEWMNGSPDGIEVTSNAKYEDFLHVTVDGETISADKYTVTSGSTIIMLKSSYLETLSVGNHTLSIVSTGGTATTQFKISPKSIDDSPQTGDNSNLILWIALLFVSGIGIFTTTVITLIYCRSYSAEKQE